MTLVYEAGITGYVGNRNARTQQTLGGFDSYLNQIGMRRKTYLPTKGPKEMKRTYLYSSGQISQRNIAAIARVDVIPDRTNQLLFRARGVGFSNRRSLTFRQLLKDIQQARF